MVTLSFVITGCGAKSTTCSFRVTFTPSMAQIFTLLPAGIIFKSSLLLAVQLISAMSTSPVCARLLISFVATAVLPIRLSALVFTCPFFIKRMAAGLVTNSKISDSTRKIPVWTPILAPKKVEINAAAAPPANQTVVRPNVAISMASNTITSTSQITAEFIPVMHFSSVCCDCFYYTIFPYG